MTTRRKRIVVSKDPNKNWANNDIQFPRVLAEMMAVGVVRTRDWTKLCKEMDVTGEQLDELFDRAQAVWDDIKARTK